MKERYFVGTVSNEKPEIEAVYWFEKKADAFSEAQRRREFYTKETTVLVKVLNIPHKPTKGNSLTEGKTE